MRTALLRDNGLAGLDTDRLCKQIVKLKFVGTGRNL